VGGWDFGWCHVLGEWDFCMGLFDRWWGVGGCCIYMGKCIYMGRGGFECLRWYFYGLAPCGSCNWT